MESEGVSLPLIHEHLMVPWNHQGKGDCCGRFETITDGYYCERCNFFVHKKCSESSEYIEHPSHAGHILQLRRNRNNYCDLCGKGIVNLFYRCEVCDFDIDIYCTKYPPPELIDISDKHHHKLTQLKKWIYVDCDAKCGKTGEKEYPYKCHECDLTFHVDCVLHPLEVKHSLEYTTIDVGNRVPLPLIHEHLMVPWNGMVKGDCCGRFESITDGFYCERCDFFVHKKCSKLSNHIQHPSHSGHTLTLRRNPNNFCNLCAKRILNLFYRCETCDFDIDLNCVSNPPPEVIQLKPSHKLILLKKRSDFDCDAKCGKSSKNEYAYKCHECDIAFHVDCVWHPPEVKHPLEVKQSLEANNEKHNEEPMNDWAELRRTLAEMQESIQATIHNSIQKLTDTVLQQREQYHESDDDVTVDELNPLGGGAGRQLDRRWESGFKLDIPEFHGGVKGEEVLDWLVVVEEILEFKEVPEDRKVALVATKFRGKAAIWWSQLKATRSRAGKEKIKSWQKLQKLLRRSFLPYNFDQTMFNRLQNLRQGARSVDDYADEFSLLITRNEIFDSELQLVSRFIKGLRPVIHSAMTQFDPTTVAKAHTRAVAFEQQLKSASSAWSTDTNWCDGKASFSAPEIGQQQQSEKNWGEDPSAVGSNAFPCGEPGHLQTACPKQGRRGLLQEETKWDTDEHTNTGEELPEDLTYGDNESLLMLRHVSMAPVVMEEPWLRKNIFHSTCTIKGKVCRFVIDSGSCHNLVAEEVIRKLGLKREEHPAPYKLTWLKEGIEVRVEHKSLVSFSIGNHYKDKAYCDVVPMDVSQFILGRPWQYDRGVMHDGRHNSHSFLFENQKIVLLPSPVLPSPTSLKEGKKAAVLLCSRTEFEHELREERCTWDVVAIEAKPVVVAPVPACFQELLTEFKDESSVHRMSS